jgi:hypothetical protein
MTKPIDHKKIKVRKNARGDEVVTFPDGESNQTMGALIEEVTGKPLDGGPLNIVGDTNG